MAALASSDSPKSGYRSSTSRLEVSTIEPCS
jgi:hypothetical protein